MGDTPTNEAAARDFIRRTIDADLAGRVAAVITRFPPEHIGHAQSICPKGRRPGSAD